MPTVQHPIGMNQELFRDFLRDELIRRCKKNPKYSLRSFSRTLQMEPSFVSKLLSGRRNFTQKVTDQICKSLSLTTHDLKSLTLPTYDENYRNIEEDVFQVISDWYHFAILELMDVQGFVPDEKWISKVLGITFLEARSAIDRLERLNLLVRNNGKWKSSGDNSTLAIASTSSALRVLQKKILEQAMVALEECPVDLRDQSAMTMSIDTKLLPQAKERIRSFRRDLCDLLQKNRKTNEVYQVSISLFPVSRINESKKIDKPTKGTKV